MALFSIGGGGYPFKRNVNSFTVFSTYLGAVWTGYRKSKYEAKDRKIGRDIGG